MRAPSEAELLILWERGVARHPIDRALLMCAWAHPDIAPMALADLPLGTLNNALLQMREALFGSRIDAYLNCQSCGEQLEISLDTKQLLDSTRVEHIPADFEVAGFRFRLPCSRDLAAIVGEHDPASAALRLLECCRLEAADAGSDDLTQFLPEIETAMEAIDPATDIGLALNCDACGHRWRAGFDIGILLWDEIDARARRLLADVHHLAQAYGWNEPEVLALSPQRRAAYLDMVGV